MNTSSAETTQHPEAGPRRARASRAHTMRTGLAAVLVFLGTFAGLTIAGVTPAGASTLDGVATIANPDGDTPLASGGSTDRLHGEPPGQRLLRRGHREQRLPRLQLPGPAGNRPDLGVVHDGLPFEGLRVSRRRRPLLREGQHRPHHRRGHRHPRRPELRTAALERGVPRHTALQRRQHQRAVGSGHRLRQFAVAR